MVELATQKEITLTSLIKESLKLVLIGGKGGVGKTTTACSLALAYARENPNKKILLISTDPAHSISDSLEEEVGSTSAPVTGSPNLYAQEIDAKKLYEEFKQKNQNIVRKILERGTYFDLEDLNNFFDLSLPGLDELMALLEVARIIRSKTYDLIILDTAPAGHTLRLLELPKLMRSVLELLELMQSKYKTIVKSLTHQYQQDDADLFITRLARELSNLSLLLKDVSQSSFVPVILPEGLSIDETKWLEHELIKLKVPIQFIIVNRVIEPNDCPFRNSRAAIQQEYLKKIQNTFSNHSIYQVPLFTKQIKGKDNLIEYSLSLKPYKPIDIKKLPCSLPLFTINFKKNCHRLPDFVKLKRDLVLFAGKGGVGKTSMSLATGAYLASHNGDKKILVVSIDPAHSISSSLETDVGGKIKEISKNLHALEIDSAYIFESFKQEYINEVQRFFEKLIPSGSVKVEYDMEIIEKLIGLSPPGLDELMALNKILEIQKEETFDLIIVDSAPTGHLLRFLEMPELAAPWIKSFIKLLYKYRSTARLDKTSKMLVDLSSDLRSVIAKLKNNQETELVAVTYPEAMVKEETKKLLLNLKELKVNCENVIINMVMPKNTCNFCVNIELEQKKTLASFASDDLLRHYKFMQVPLGTTEIKGVSTLVELGRWLYE